MKSRIFNKSQAENKKLAAKYVLDAIAEPQFAEIWTSPNLIDTH